MSVGLDVSSKMKLPLSFLTVTWDKVSGVCVGVVEMASLLVYISGDVSVYQRSTVMKLIEIC